MKFHRVIGKIEPDLVERAETALSRVFLDLATNPKTAISLSIGGDPLIFSLVQPMQHVATRNLPTAGTDGKRYYWNPNFILSKSKLGLRLVCEHEAWHAIYMHPERRGGRNPKLWNIAVDYIVNFAVMEDLRIRKQDAVAVFTKELGNFCTLEQYMEHLKNPFVKIKGSEHWVPEPSDEGEKAVALPHPNDERELTEEEKKEIEKQEARVRYFFADPNLAEDMRRPERIYDLLYNLLPKCDKCGRVGMYPFPKNEKSKGKEDKKNKKNKKDKDNHDHQHDQDCEQSCDHNHSSNQDKSSNEDNSSDQDNSDDQSDQDASGSSSRKACGHCDKCCGGYDILETGDTLDDHMDAEESPEKTAKRIANAMNVARQMAGTVPAGLEDELGQLISPKVKWQDVIRSRIHKSRDGNTKNDWTRYRSRPLFANLMVPKRINQVCNFVCLLDTSGSMSQEDMTYGVSQLQSIDERSEGYVVPSDSEIYWKKATKLKRCNAEEIAKIKICGRGGTMFSTFFTDYEKEVGKADFLIIITDGFLLDNDVASMINPGIPVYWILTSSSSFNAPFGKVFDLKS